MTLQQFYNQLSKLSVSNVLTKKYYFRDGQPIDNPFILERIENNPDEYEYIESILLEGLMIIHLDI